MKSKILSESVKAVIREEVDSHFKNFGSPLPLSTLGQRLMRRGIDLKRAFSGKKMRGVLEAELDSEYLVRKVEGLDLSYEILPKDAAQTVAAAATHSGQIRNAAWLPSPVWLAFTRPIDDGCARFVNLVPFRFEDRSISDISDSEIYISSSEIVYKGENESASEWAARVNAGLASWLELRGLSLDDLRNSSTRADSLLDRIMASLSKGQKERVLIPLDVIEVLRGTH